MQQQLPQLAVITVNLQPVHMAILEGEQEIYLTEQQVLREQLNQVPLFIRPHSFFKRTLLWLLGYIKQRVSGLKSLISLAYGIFSAVLADLAYIVRKSKLS